MPVDSRHRPPSQQLVANPMPHSQRGQIGSAKRWGPRRNIRLTDLDPVTADIIRAIIAARENAGKTKVAAADDQRPTTASEVQRASAERSAA